MSNVINREYERERKSTNDLRKTEYEFNVMEKRITDQSKWKIRAEKTNLIKDINNTSDKLTPSVDEWLEKKKQRNIRKANSGRILVKTPIN